MTKIIIEKDIECQHS